MGRYVNPGNDAFAIVVNDEYVDKTGLIGLFDESLNTPRRLVMVSRPRRFGKSFAAQSLVAFYSCGCDSRSLFEGLEVSRHDGWDSNINRYNVIRLDMTEVIQEVGAGDISGGVAKMILPELRDIVPNAGARAARPSGELTSAILDVVSATGRKFVFVIDEWDAPYRLARDDKAAQDAYADWLRALFKGGSFAPHAVAGAYMTGILPIKKYNHQSAVSDFMEYTMVRPGKYAPYVGFTEAEVEGLCARHGLRLADVRRWYNGYELHVPKAAPEEPSRIRSYAPYSVMQACAMGEVGSYWTSTETYETLIPYIDMDFDGLQGDVVRAIGGGSLRVNPTKFQNDMVSIRSSDDVLTLLIHLGYLTYSAETRRACVPNEEVRGELRNAVEESSHAGVARIMRESIQLVEDAVAMDEQAVAEAIQHTHDVSCSPRHYNGEEALRAVVKAAFIAAVDEWAVVDELPSGRGFADVAFVPKRGSSMPAMLVELKWNKPVDAAIDQIRRRDYPQVLRDLDVPVLLVGITYDASTKEHVCRIERLAAGCL